ncbi:Hsp20/alpha crystallin family protein [Brevundimonas vesicularis]|uniref:Hsp20/alpha crystallin family protein n=1 Tax=Brevundimonas vesicularis TaxID=41276 RepID=UPI001C2CECF7|nr:Hsp20 family protein [Brevundimonas vesicularis]
MLYPTYLCRSDPFALMPSMMRDLDRGFWPPSRAAFPAVNVWQGSEAVAVTGELPGIEPGDIEISVKDNVLTLSGERKLPEVPKVRAGTATNAVMASFPALSACDSRLRMTRWRRR